MSQPIGVTNQDLHAECMRRLKTDRRQFPRSGIETLIKEARPPLWLRDSRGYTIDEQMRYDLRTYKLWDAMAMWVGDGGLVEYWPGVAKVVKAMLRVVPYEQ